MRFASSGFRLIVAATAFALVTIGILHSQALDASESAVKRSVRYDLGWTGTLGRLEMLQLRGAVATYLLTGSDEDAKAVKLAAEILEGRFRIWDAGGFGAYLDQKDKRRARFEQARTRYREMLPVLADPAAAGADDLRALLPGLSGIADLVDRIGAEAHAFTTVQAEEVRTELLQKQRTQNWLTIGLFALIGLIMGMMALQNRSLGVAHKAATRSAEDFAHLAHHDALTGLPNRIAFTAAYDARMASLARDPGREVAILAIDLDGFKSVNDLLGHATGDALLIAVARRLEALLGGTAGEGDHAAHVSRFGGDEFVIMLDVSRGVEQAQACTRKILDALHAPFVIHGSTVAIGATIGIALAHGAATDSNALLDADLALSRAKAAGKGMIQVFDPSMRAGHERRVRLEADMKDALANGEIRPFYQVKVDIATRLISGVEALARWHHPDLGWISPAEFVPIAESSSQIVDLGRAILEASCRDALAFPGDITVAVNLSVGQMLRDDIVETVTGILARTGLPARRLTLEVTESVMITEPGKAIQILTWLKALGISIALDDFGTGYSALAYLRQFAWDEVKIDRGFVEELHSNPRSRAIVKSVLRLARELGMKVTAEGIETREQLELLGADGCATGQGYFFGKPAPSADIPTAILRAMSDVPYAPVAPSIETEPGTFRPALEIVPEAAATRH